MSIVGKGFDLVGKLLDSKVSDLEFNTKYRKKLQENLLDLSNKAGDPEMDLGALRQHFRQQQSDQNDATREQNRVNMELVGAPTQLDARGRVLGQNLGYQGGIIDKETNSRIAEMNAKGGILGRFQQGTIDNSKYITDTSTGRQAAYLDYRREQENADRAAATKYSWLEPVRTLLGAALLGAGVLKG